MYLTLPKTTLDLSTKTHIMGILNITPDSFSDGGKFQKNNAALFHAEAMLKAGADIIDVGGESSRPGAASVSENEEIDRILPVIEKLNSVCPVISIDTVKSGVAKEALKAGAQIVNDISGLHFDSKLAETVASGNAAIILMHIQGEPRTMQANPHYDNLIDDIKDSLKQSIDIAKKAGIRQNQIVIDPGIGFGKTVQDNLILIRDLETFKELGYPLLIGVSRKSFIGKINNTETQDRLSGSLAAMSAAVMNGAHIIRVHDVGESCQAVAILDSIRKGDYV